MTLAYNALTTASEAAFLLVLLRWPSVRVQGWGLLLAGGVAIVATGLGETAFDVARLTGWGLFVHAPGALAGSALVLRSRRGRAGRAGRQATTLAAAAAVVLALIGLYAYGVEPRWIEVTHVRISSPKLREPLRIAVLSDIQTDRVGAHERRALELAMRERPDIVLLTGDYVQEQDPARFARRAAELNALLREVGLEAPLGVHAVDGNTDGQGWELVFEGLPVETITRTRSRDVGDIRLTALAGWDSFRDDLSVAASDRFHVAFGHSPDFALGELPADLLVAGHTHGGQVRLPFVGPLVTFSRIPRAWASGLTALPGGRWLVVSRGIGMERAEAPRLRFLCRPEVVIIDVVPARPDG